MADYKAMYHHLLGRMESAIDTLETATNMLETNAKMIDASAKLVESNAKSMTDLKEKFKQAMLKAEDIFVNSDDETEK